MMKNINTKSVTKIKNTDIQGVTFYEDSIFRDSGDGRFHCMTSIRVELTENVFLLKVLRIEQNHGHK